MVLTKFLKQASLKNYLLLLAAFCFSAQTFAMQNVSHAQDFDPMDVDDVSDHKDNKISFERYRTFYQWKNGCDELPFYKDIEFDCDTIYQTPLKYEEFAEALEEYKKLMTSSELACEAAWTNSKAYENSLSKFFDSSLKNVFQPYIEKRVMPAGNTIIFKGDLHGDIHSLIEFINTLIKLDAMDEKDPFKISADWLSIVFLGDYTDRGIYGLEVLYTLMRLKLANPNKVFLVRGNHEDIGMNMQESGFYSEMSRKLSNTQTIDSCCFKLLRAVGQFYNLLPACLYLGIKERSGFIHYIQCCHGGMEIGYDPFFFLQGNKTFEFLKYLTRNQNAKKISCLKDHCKHLNDVDLEFYKHYGNIGFMWSDFNVDPEEDIKPASRGGDIISYSKKVTQEMLFQLANPSFRICAIMRAHQHDNNWSDMMKLILDYDNKCPLDKGVGKLWKTNQEQGAFWNGIVCTLMVSPDNLCGNENYSFPANSIDYCAFLHTKDTFDAWHLQMVGNDIYS